MRKLKNNTFLFFLLFVLLYAKNGFSQILHPVHWSYAAKKTGKNQATILIKASIDDGWHVYSVNQKDGGPIKTSFVFASVKAFRLIDSVSEPKPITRYEDAFKMNVNYFEKVVVFQQKVMLTSKDAVVRGKISFMTCNDQKCLPPDEVTFRIQVK